MRLSCAGVEAALVLLKEARTHTDQGLVEECRKGDSTAFDELVRRYKDRIYYVVYRFLGNREDALDVCQEVFVRAYKSLHTYRGRAQVYTWLYSIAANLAKNRLRDGSRKGRNQGVSLDALEEHAPGALASASNAKSPSDVVMDCELQHQLQACLAELPEPYRIVFVLRTFDDMSYEDIAEAVGCPVGTVKSRLNQSRKLLRDALKSRGIM
ncbi:MAG: RNA polymerase sigma24 factor [Candidatus Hydrogenedentota bacterium]